MSKKNVKHSKNAFPALFFRSISKEALEEHGRQKIDRKKYLWLWTCVGLVMAAVIFFWATTVPNRLKLDSASDATAQLFKENKDKLSELFDQNKNLVEFLSASPEIYNKLAAALASSAPTASSTLGLTPEQIEDIKNKIDKK